MTKFYIQDCSTRTCDRCPLGGANVNCMVESIRQLHNNFIAFTDIPDEHKLAVNTHFKALVNEIIQIADEHKTFEQAVKQEVLREGAVRLGPWLMLSGDTYQIHHSNGQGALVFASFEACFNAFAHLM